jgi:serine/threonine-protein kinase
MSSNMPTALASGRYQLGQLIGRGGMAEVHVALDTRLGRTVAIKIMRAELANDDIFLARFRREAHAVAQMNNPNIVNIFDSGEETVTAENGGVERLPYIVMEYVKGQTLRDIIKVNGALSQRDCEQVMLGVLNALDYSHRMGIIHRDIKPGNIMISEQGVVKVMDFGIARALDDSAATMTQSQGVVGTAQYLSPEQARGETVDMRSDLYSAGCVLYEMLTGRPPFTGDSAVAIAYQHVSEVATPPSAVVPGLPKMWDSICAKAMAKDRQNRYATASEYKNDILTFMNGGIPVAAAFNPLTDLSNMKARKDAERDVPTTPMAEGPASTATQAFNPVTGQFEQIHGAIGPNNPTAVQSRADQRAAAAKAKRKKQIIIGSVIGAIAVIALVAGLVLALNGGGTSAVETVTVPECTVSTSKDGIEAKLEALGLRMTSKQDTDSTEPAGTCTKMDPKAGSKVDKGSTVKVWFSAGPQSISVPDVTDQSQEEARSTLEDAGFTVNSSVKTEDSDSIDKDNVTRTDPVAGSSQPKGTSISIYVSSGMTKVPDNLVGQPQAVLDQYSGRFSFVVQSEYSDTVAEGSITRVEPGSGSSIAQHSSINVWVSQGKEQVTVPSIAAGTSYATAKLTLEASGFTVQSSGPTDANAVVVSINPAGGAQADKGATITVTTKAGTTTPEPDTPDDNTGDGQ